MTRIESPEGARYAAVPAEELLARLERQFQQTVEGARVELAQLARPVEPSYVWNLSGYTVALEHAQSLLAGSEHQLLLGLYPEEAAALEEAIAGAEARGLPITTLCMAGCATPCGGCRGTLHRYRQPTEAQERWLLVVADGAEALAAEIRDESGAMAMRSRQPLLVKLTGWFIRHTITLATLVNALGSRLEQQSDTEAESVLTPDAEDWLTTLRGILRESPARP